MESSKMDNTFLGDGGREGVADLREEISVLREELGKLLSSQPVRDDSKLTEIRAELDMLKEGLQSEMKVLADKVKELEEYSHGEVKLGGSESVRPGPDEVNNNLPLKTNNGAGSGGQSKEGSGFGDIEENKAKQSTTSAPQEPLAEDTKKMEKAEVTESVETSGAQNIVSVKPKVVKKRSK